MRAPVVAGVNLPLDDEAVSPHGLRAAFEMGVGRLEHESEKRGHALDWETLTFRVAKNMVLDEENPAPYRAELRIERLS